VRGLARWCYRHRWIVVIAWIGVVVAVNAIESSAGTNFNDNFSLRQTESHKAQRLLAQSAPRLSGDTEEVVIYTAHGHVTDAAPRARFDALLAELSRMPHVSEVQSPYGSHGAGQIAPDRRIAFADVTFDLPVNAISGREELAFVHNVTSASRPGTEFEDQGQVAEGTVNNDDTHSLIVGFIAAGFVLFLVFGSLLAMVLPLLTAAVSLGTGIAIIGLLSHTTEVASFSGELAALIGLGVGVDYALFVVTRYRQARLRGVESEDATVEAIDTSGRAVLFAGTIVVIAMLGMLLLRVPFLYGVAFASAIAVALTVVAALTLLPALLSLFGSRVLRRGERRAIRDGRHATTDESRAWARWATWMARRPRTFLIAGAAILVILAIPFFSMRLGSADSSSDPTSSTTYKSYELLAKGFGPGYNGPLQLVARVDSGRQRDVFAEVLYTVAQNADVASVTSPTFVPGAGGGAEIAVARVYPRGGPQAASTVSLLSTVRGTIVPRLTAGSGVRVLVGGQTAVFADFSAVLSSKLPLFVGIVVFVSFLLLLAVFRSVLIPLTAALANLLSAGAAFGVVTAVFQFGWGASLLGISATGPIEAFLPVLMFPILFGLSMDYEVFLVARIYEEWHRRLDNTEAVHHGLAATGRTITAAAAIMVLVFGSFVLGGSWIIELFGVGFAGSVFLDALMVRSVLVPATMFVIGDANWRIPAWLDRRLPHFSIEGGPTSVPVAVAGEPAGAIAPVAGPEADTDTVSELDLDEPPLPEPVA
jgi:putative drug exporter of the RND superfamily